MWSEVICIEQADAWFPYIRTEKERRETRFLLITMCSVDGRTDGQVEVFRSRGESTQLIAKDLPAKTFLDVEVKLKC